MNPGFSRTLAVLVAASLIFSGMEPAAAAARDSERSPVPVHIDRVASVPAELMLGELQNFPDWLDAGAAQAPQAASSLEQARARRAALTMLDAPQIFEPHRMLLTERWNAGVIEALDAAHRRLQDDPALARRLSELRASLELSDAAGAPPSAEKADRLFDNHVVVAGLGQVGKRAVEVLRGLGERAVVVTEKISREEKARLLDQGIPVFHGMADQEALLRQAGIGRAKAFIAVADDDPGNLSLMMMARRLNPKAALVGRIQDRELSSQIQNEASIRARSAVGVDVISAPVLAASVLNEQVAASFRVDQEAFTVGYLSAKSVPDLEGRAIRELQESLRLFPLAIARAGKLQFFPAPDAKLGPGDELVVLGPTSRWQAQLGHSPRNNPLPKLLAAARRVLWRFSPATRRTVAAVTVLAALGSAYYHLAGLTIADAILLAISRILNSADGDLGPLKAILDARIVSTLLNVVGIFVLGTLVAIVVEFLSASNLRGRSFWYPVPRKGHVLVAGAGTVGFEVAKELQAMGKSVAVIEKDADSEFVRFLYRRAAVLEGDAGQESILEEAGLKRASAVVAATGSDEKNIAIAVLARRINPKAQLVIRTYDPKLVRAAQDLGIPSVHSTSAIAAPAYVGSALHPDAVGSFVLGGQFVVVSRRSASPEPGSVAAAAKTRGGQEFLPISAGSVPPKDAEVLDVLVRPLRGAADPKL